ncbi:hypothetical protein Q75_01995 [Bacillus coahuilensis p1.1.43]|uniref:YvlB/LiaX N-terminal domain-containing protein n=1 Tax=Bacillus coahuilensis p1.1.43 TaxID=1150625 RepID=A0A147KBS3_9BACI|nr:hypothetical protein [Bacillus coahuilensis]KUP08867.1 hypothetical protein Q75_01995 [Bacillus coahuilensis p1.1.43]
MKEEITKVLDLLEAGKVSREEASELISALNEAPVARVENSAYMKKSLRVIVDSEDGDKVNVNLPLKLVKSLHGAIENMPAVKQHLQGVDISLILDAISNNVEGPIVDIKGADGESVSVVIE